MSFQKLVIGIALVCLFILLIIIGYTMYNAKKTDQWPPVIGDCPDYWIDLEGEGAACFNSKSLGTCNVPTDGDKNTMNFSQAPYTGSDGDCAKYLWAKGCNVTWDGINSGVSNPCNNDDDDDN